MNYIDITMYKPNEVIGLLIAVSDQLNISHGGKAYFGVFLNQMNVINSISSKYNLGIHANTRNMECYSLYINEIASSLVEKGILDESRLLSDLKAYLLQNPL